MIQKNTLPIDSHLDSIANAYRNSSALIIKAEPGAGKTTRIPQALLSITKKKILVIEPRRLAARLSAERVASELDEPVGKRVGYQIRFDKKESEDTKVKFITEGIFTRLVHDDPFIDDIGCVIIDEFHERHIHSDIALAMTKNLIEKHRPDLKLIIMSATIETGRLENYLKDARVFDIKGKVFPVAIEYLEPPKRMSTEVFIDHAVEKMLQDERCQGNILVFMTGMHEIMKTVNVVKKTAQRHSAIVLPLTAELSAKDQNKIFESSSERKIIISTNVAETSVTIPEITGVIDLGLAKIAGFGAWSGISTLDVKRICQASCIQRTGRAGRTRSGVCYRLFPERDFLGRPYAISPEICRVDLSQTILELLHIALKGGRKLNSIYATFSFLDLPEKKTTETLVSLLKRLGALDSEGFLAQKGMDISSFPIHPRLASIILKGKEKGALETALLASCLLNEGMIAKRVDKAVDAGPCDLSYQIDLFFKYINNEEWESDSQKRLVDSRKVLRVKMLFDKLGRQAGVRYTLGSSKMRGDLAKKVREDISKNIVGEILLAGFPDRVAKARIQKQKGKKRGPVKPLFNLCLGRGGMLDESSVVKKSDLIIALDAVESHQRNNAAMGTQIRVASAINLNTLVSFDSDLKREETEVVWDQKDEKVVSLSNLYYGNLTVGSRVVDHSSADWSKIESVLCEAVKNNWDKAFEDPESLDLYHNRIELLERNGINEDFPVFVEEMYELLLSYICEGKESFNEIQCKSLLQYIEEQLSYNEQIRLAKLLPLNFPIGRRKVTINYEKDKPPWVSARIQEFFGVRENPAVADGQIPLVVHLLGPNLRPVQVTQDLMGFWQRSYPKIRSELKRRYPKHAWPENPMENI